MLEKFAARLSGVTYYENPRIDWHAQGKKRVKSRAEGDKLLAQIHAAELLQEAAAEGVKVPVYSQPAVRKVLASQLVGVRCCPTCSTVQAMMQSEVA